MGDGSQVITLIDQFDKVLLLAGIVRNSHGDKYTLYSLRHFYAVVSLRRGSGVFDVARNMGTSVRLFSSITVSMRRLGSWRRSWVGDGMEYGSARLAQEEDGCCYH